MDSHYRPRREPNRLPANGRRSVPSRSNRTDADRQWRQAETRTRQQQRRRPPRRIEDTPLPPTPPQTHAVGADQKGMEVLQHPSRGYRHRCHGVTRQHD